MTAGATDRFERRRAFIDAQREDTPRTQAASTGSGEGTGVPSHGTPAAGGPISRPDDAEAVAAALWLRGAVAAGHLDLPQAGGGATAARFAALAALAGEDLVRARLGEGHVDAVAILAELGGAEPGGAELGGAEPGGAELGGVEAGGVELGVSSRRAVWGVWAAAPGSLRARCGAGGWTLSGQRPWCSGAWACSQVLVTAVADDGIRLFAVDTEDPGLSAVAGSWAAVGMAGSDTRSVVFRETAAVAVGGPGDYVSRPGFSHGAIGVAACWYGGAVGVARLLLRRAQADAPGHRDPHLMAHLGAVEAGLAAASDTLLAAAAHIDACPGTAQVRLAARVRAGVEAAATEVITRVGRACGAEPMGHDRAHARRVADLTVYLRQSHAERDLAQLGTRVAEEQDPATAWAIVPPVPHAVSGRG